VTFCDLHFILTPVECMTTDKLWCTGIWIVNYWMNSYLALMKEEFQEPYHSVSFKQHTNRHISSEVYVLTTYTVFFVTNFVVYHMCTSYAIKCCMYLFHNPLYQTWHFFLVWMYFVMWIVPVQKKVSSSVIVDPESCFHSTLYHIVFNFSPTSD